MASRAWLPALAVVLASLPGIDAKTVSPTGEVMFTTSDVEWIKAVKLAHGVMATLAFGLFFPAGAISIRLMSGKAAIWVHTVCQVFALAMFVAAFGMGVNLAMFIDATKRFHPRIGIILFPFMIIQLLLGVIHHLYFKKYNRRTFWTHAHLWLGRAAITLGMINGGLGLWFASEYAPGHWHTGQIVYGSIAGTIWMIWMCAAVYGEVKRLRQPATQEVYNKTADSSPQENVSKEVVV